MESDRLGSKTSFSFISFHSFFDLDIMFYFSSFPLLFHSKNNFKNYDAFDKWSNGLISTLGNKL